LPQNPKTPPYVFINTIINWINSKSLTYYNKMTEPLLP